MKRPDVLAGAASVAAAVALPGIPTVAEALEPAYKSSGLVLRADALGLPEARRINCIRS